MIYKSVITALVIFLIALVELTAGQQAPTRFDSYDGIAPGARATAMGGAFVALADDVSAVFYNPAGLAEISRGAVCISYEATRQSELATDEIFSRESLRARNIQAISLVSQKAAFSWRPLSNSTWRTQSGADWQEDEIKINAFTVSASNKDEGDYATGMNLTYLSGQIAQARLESGSPYINLSDGYGFSADFGVLYTPSKQIRLGVNFKNIAGYMWWDDFEKDQLPFIVKTGIDFQIKGFTNFCTEWERRYYRKTDELSITRFGIEQMVGNILALRTGISGSDLNDKEKSSFSGGIGYMQNSFELSLTAERYTIDKKDVYRYLISINIPI